MVAYDQIEKLKSEYTDKWVSVVDEKAPELSRYHDRFGQVKTINMNGRALVEFHGGVDTGWIDIDLNYLKVVEKPDFEAMEKEKKAQAKAAPKAKPAAKPAAAKGADGQKLSPLEMARQMGAKKKDGGGAKQSTADILAAARGKGGDTKQAKDAPAKEDSPKPSGGKMSTADILAAARAKKEAEAGAAPREKAAEEKPAAKAAPETTAPAKPAGGKLSTADILAAARAKGAGAPAKEETPAEPEPVAQETVVEETPAKEEAPAAKSEKPSGDLPKDVAGMLEYCRKADSN